MALLSLRILILWLPLLVCMGALRHALGERPVFDQYRVKAAFLFNFAKFVEWPPQAFQSAGQPIAICVLGQDPFGSSLDEVVQGKAIGNRKFVVLEISSAKQCGKCHILFVSASQRKRLRADLAEIQGCCALTVGETEEFIDSGGMINLRVQDTHVHMEIDRYAAERAGLRISSKLLSLAEIATK